VDYHYHSVIGDAKGEGWERVLNIPFENRVVNKQYCVILDLSSAICSG